MSGTGEIVFLGAAHYITVVIRELFFYNGTAMTVDSVIPPSTLPKVI